MSLTDRRIAGRIAALAVPCLVNTPAQADQVTLHPVADTTLIQVAPGNNLGGADFFNAGTAGNGNRNRALMQFDLSGSIPPGSTINFAILSLDIIRQPGMDLQTATFGLHRVLTSWGEGTEVPEDPGSPGVGAPAMDGEATWLHRFSFDVPWAAGGGAPGIDFSILPSTTTYVYGIGDPVEFESTVEAAADAQLWLDHPETNFGWLLMTETEQVRKSARSFASREDPNGGPSLLLDFTPVPEPDTLVLWTAALGAAGFFRCVRKRENRRQGSRD